MAVETNIRYGHCLIEGRTQGLNFSVVENHPQALDGDQLNLGVAIFMLGSALVPLFAGIPLFLSIPFQKSHP